MIPSVIRKVESHSENSLSIIYKIERTFWEKIKSFFFLEEYVEIVPTNYFDKLRLALNAGFNWYIIYPGEIFFAHGVLVDEFEMEEFTLDFNGLETIRRKLEYLRHRAWPVVAQYVVGVTPSTTKVILRFGKVTDFGAYKKALGVDKDDNITEARS